MKRLANKTALITGATRGIGTALARGFAREGAYVLLHGRDHESGSALAQELNGKFFPADLARPEQVDELAASIGREVSCLEMVMPFASFDFHLLDMMWQLNLRAPAQLIHALLPKLQAAGSASVINVTSIHQTVPCAHNGGYAMTKAALGMLTQTLSIELAPLGIRINNFAPGAVETDMNREIIERMRKDFAEWIPAGRVAHTDEMIGPAVFLASDESAYVNGATLVADGGYSHNLVRYRP